MDRKEFYNSLSEDVKEKIKACKSDEEMLKVLEEEKIELAPEILEGVSGGYCFEYAQLLKRMLMCRKDTTICVR